MSSASPRGWLPDDVARRARRHFVDTRRPILDGQLTQMRALAALTIDTLLERRPTVIADLEPRRRRRCRPALRGQAGALPAQAAEAVAAMHAAPAPFTAAELPGRLDAAGRLVLVRRLVREGFLLAPVVTR